MVRPIRLPRRTAFVALAAVLALWSGGAASAGPSVPCQGDGCVCTPNARNFGYFRTCWREWPCEKRLEKTFPQALGAEALPAPEGQEALPPPKAAPVAKEGAPTEQTPEAPKESGELLMPGNIRTEGGLPGLPGGAEKPLEPGIPSLESIPGVPGALQKPEEPAPPRPQKPEESAPPRPPKPASAETLPGIPTDPSTSQDLLPEPPTNPGSPPAAAPKGADSPPPTPGSVHTAADVPQIPPRLDLPPEVATGLTKPIETLPATPADSVDANAKTAASKAAHIEPAAELPPVDPPKTDSAAAGPKAPPPEAKPALMLPTVAEARPLISQVATDVQPRQPVVQRTSEAPAAEPAAREQATEPAAVSPLVALEGFCPVELAKNEQWVEGSPRWTAVYQGKSYRLSGPAQRQSFLADPVRYVPVCAGDDPVLLSEENRRVPGKTDYCVTCNGRLYMFSSPATLEKFQANPKTFAGLADK